MKKTGRNDPCPCGSGKKFKKCCANKMIGKKFMAHKIDDLSKSSNSVSSFFQHKLSENTHNSLANRTIKISSNNNQKIEGNNSKEKPSSEEEKYKPIE